MSATALAKRPASVVREYTQQVKDHSSAMERLRDQYLARLARAQADYFNGVKRITDALTAGEESSTDAPIPNGNGGDQVDATAG